MTDCAGSLLRLPRSPLPVLRSINKYKQDVNENTPSAAMAARIINFSYTDFKKDYPDMTPLDFVKKIQEEYPNLNFTCDGIKNVDELKKLARASEYAPDMAIKYNYLYEEDPEKAAQYVKDIRYEINNIEGQIEAKEFLEKLKEAGDDEDKLDEIIFNEFGVHLEGLYDGLDSFVMGVYHTGEAGYTGIQKLGKTLGIYDGEVYENRVMDVSEYKKMYILQGLMSKENKEKLGLLNEDGTSTNQIIDFSKEYTGKFLNNNYEISQGIGNMIPSIILSTVNPAAGSVAMGISAGGNAYHGAMVEGSDYMSALMYGIYSGSSEAITERMLGGLPGLSDVKVTGLKTYLQSMAKEGSQEIIQGVMEDVYQWTLMGKELPTTPEEWAEWAKGKGKEGIYGAITAGYLNVPSLTINTISPQTAKPQPAISKQAQNYNDYIKNNNVQVEDIDAATQYLKSNDQTGKISSMTNEQIINEYGDKLVDYLKKSKTTKAGGDPSVLGVDDEITEELDFEDTLELATDEIPTVEIPTQEIPKYEIPIEEFNDKPSMTTSPEFNAQELKNEINSLVKPGMSEIEKARVLYMELNKRINYDIDYLADRSTQSTKYNRVLSFDNLQDSNVVCKGWSELYREILLENGFDAENVRLAGGGGQGKHVWIEITLSDGNIIIADATDNIAHSIDLANSKIGLPTKGFVYTTKDNSGKRLNNINNIDLVKGGMKQWNDIDSKLGYNIDGMYVDDVIKEADNMFGDSNAYNNLMKEPPSKRVVDFLKMDLPNSLDGYEGYVYYNAIQRLLFSNDNNIRFNTGIVANYTGTTYEGMTTLDITIDNKQKIYMTYSKSTGKHIFTDYQSYSNYLNSLDTMKLGG